MKKAFPRVFLLILIAAILSALALTSSAVSYPPEEMRGVWIASVYNIDFPSKTNLTATEMKNEIDEIMKNAKGMNLNAVFFQVRPSADALYKSSIFPWSAVLTGTQGKTPSDSFDPLSYAVESAHKNGLELHAWINPFKITRGSVKSPNTDLSKLAASHPARKNPDLVVSSGGELYFDPGEPKARQLIIDGVREIVENYDVDGIHFDDYFYPGRDFDDAASYKKYGSSYKNIGDYRRANVDSFISTCYQTIKRLDPSVKFGVSPFAVWANKKNVSEGSDTSGGVETYLDHYADTKKWVKEGYIDYIAPQVYWNIGFKAADYETLVKWWSNVCKNTNVKLYVGHAAYKIGDSSQSTSWLDPFEIPNQVKDRRRFGKHFLWL